MNLNNIYKDNFTNLFKSLTQSLASLSRQSFSWIDRIHIIKEFITSKFLFLTQMLPLAIPKVDLHKWQTMLNTFIWSNRRHRILHKTMRLSRNRGSVGVPDIRLYFEAAQLANVLRILSSDLKTDWMSMEFDNPNGQTPQEIIRTPSQRRPTSLKNNPYCAITLQIWDKWKIKLTGKLSSLVSLTTLTEFPEDLKHLIST